MKKVTFDAVQWTVTAMLVLVAVLLGTGLI
jgi:hypothetical protein